MKKLEGFQIEGRDFLASRFHAANGDQPGLGKTVQAIHAAALVGGSSSTWLVTCPASVRSNWYEHVEEHYGHTRGWDIISYNLAATVFNNKNQSAGIVPVAARLRDRYTGWIGDEIQFCKNLESQRTLAVFGRSGLARRAKYKWPMSGTLAPNGRPVELFPMLKTLCSEFKGMSFGTYTQKYCGGFFDGRSWNVKGASRIDELSALLRSFMIRRTKREVYPDRKEPLIARIPLELSSTDMAAVLAAEDEIGGREVRLSSSFDKFSQLGDTSRLLRLLGLAKLRHTVDFVDDLLSTVDKVVVFYKHTDVGEGLRAALSQRGYNPSVYKGGMTDAQKDYAKDFFRCRRESRVFIGQQQAAGTGINGLQKVCSTAVLAEPPWVPGDTEQIIDRLDRMGQEDDLVNAYILYAKDTLDEVVTVVHDRKERTGERLLGDERRSVGDAFSDADVLGQL